MSAARYPGAPVLLVDDEERFLASAAMTLASEGITNIAQCPDGSLVLARLAAEEHAVVLLDISMPRVSGRELLPRIVAEHPDLPVIMITGINEADTAVECMKAGAFDYLVKPVEDARLVSAVKRAVEMRQVRRENALLVRYLLSDELAHPETFSAIITRSKKMRSIFQYAETIAGTPQPVLITGETGVGKELIAVAIHRLSGRSGEFVPVNVAGLDDTLFSDALFGHRKGGFTGADRDRSGLIESAAGGTLFLDEIGDLGPQSQVKLLRLLQEGRYYPIGSDTQRASEARFIVATNKDLRLLQEKGEFRTDLYYRLRTHHIHLPPLRSRQEDLPLLVEHFLAKAAQSLGRGAPTPPKELFTLLGAYPFPGNIRELEGMVYDAVSRHRSGMLSMESFREKIGVAEPAQASPESAAGESKLMFGEAFPTLREAEQAVIDEALKRAKGNQSVAAQLLGMSRRALNNRLQRSTR